MAAHSSGLLQDNLKARAPSQEPLYHHVQDMWEAMYMCELSQLKGSQQVSAIVTHNLAWYKVTWGQPLLSLPTYLSVNPVSQIYQLQNSMAAICLGVSKALGCMRGLTALMSNCLR